MVEDRENEKRERVIHHPAEIPETTFRYGEIRKMPVGIAERFLPHVDWPEDEKFVPSEIYESTYDISGLEPADATVNGQRPNEVHTIPLDGLISRMGGKKQLKAWLISRFPRPDKVKTYVEPFGGSFQVFLGRPWRNKIEIVNDIDADVIHFYRYARYNPSGLADFINGLPTHEAMILGMRAELVRGELKGIERAAAFYVCSSSAFNAIISDSLGRYASSPHVLVNTRIDMRKVMLVAERLLGVDIRCTSYERVLQSAVKEVPGGLFVYLDPPYDQTTGYEGYQGEHTFGWDKQVQLAEYCDMIDRVGGRFIQTNSDTERLKNLYGSFKRPDGSPKFFITRRMVYYSVAGGADKRQEAGEFIISNFPLEDEDLKRQSRLF